MTPMKERILNIETVHQCNCCLGCKTLHPLVSVIDLSKSNLEQQIIKFDFYTILMMEGEIDDVLYGRKYYDYSNASLVFLTPGESIKINKSKALPSKGWLLAFHPDLISQTSLGEHIKDYSFFFYNIHFYFISNSQNNHTFTLYYNHSKRKTVFIQKFKKLF